MFRTVLNAALLPLELISLGVSSSEMTAGTWWLLGGTVLIACPGALDWARRFFGEDPVEIEESLRA